MTACPSCSGPLAQIPQVDVGSCLGCGRRWSGRELRELLEREGERALVILSPAPAQPVSRLALYLSCLEAARSVRVDDLGALIR